MRLIDKIKASGDSPFYTFEFFPPRTDQVGQPPSIPDFLVSKIDRSNALHTFSSFFLLQGFSNLLSRISRLTELKPAAISITWGAGGSTRDRTLELASVTQRDYGVDTVMHITCTNMEQGMVDDALRVRSLSFLSLALLSTDSESLKLFGG